MPKVSVVIPTYNHAPMLKLALESVRAQTEPDWEAIVINNYSEDDTIEVIDSFSDERIKRYDYRNQGIIAASRNEGIRRASAEWIAFLDSDDLWVPEKLEKSFAALKPETEAVTHPEEIVVDGIKRGTTRVASAERVTSRALLFQGNCLSPSAIMIKRSVLLAVDGFDESADVVTAEDFDLWLRLAEKRIRFAFVSEPLGQYTLHQANSSGSIERHMAASLRVLNTHVSRLCDKRLFDSIIIRRARARIVYGAGRSCQRLGNAIPARYLYLKSLKIYPMQPKALFSFVQTFI